MSKIRYIRKSDYEYINRAVIDYGTFFSNYAETATNLLIKYNGILSSTLIVETDNGDIAGFDINILKPYSFWQEFYKNLSFLKKIKWLSSNRSQQSISNKCDDEFQDIYNNLYKTDNKAAYTLFYKFNKNTYELVKASDIGILQLKLIANTHKYQTAEIKTDNTASIKSYTRRGFNTTKYFEYEKNVLFSVININNIKDAIQQYQINHLIELDNNLYKNIRGGVSRKLICLKERLVSYFATLHLNNYKKLLLGGSDGNY